MLRQTKSRFLSGKSTIIFNAVLIIMLAFFGACDNKPGISFIGSSDSGNCGIRDSFTDNIVIYRIPDTCAEGYINEYRAYINGVKDTLLQGGADPTSVHQNLIHGAKVEVGDLRQVLLHYNARETDSIYIMMGIVDSTAELIFTIQSYADTETSGDDSYKSFDFTMPCPPMCPTKYTEY